MDCTSASASFDLNNPALSSQTFNVMDESPQVVLDREIPMMRNRNNDSIFDSD